jgi:hypothetical protein
MLQNAPRKIGRISDEIRSDPALRRSGTRRALSRRERKIAVLGLSESLITFVDGAGGVLSFVELRLPAECRVLGSLVGTLAAVGVQILHIRVQRDRDQVNHRLRVAECDGSEVACARRFEVEGAVSNLVERELENVRRPLSKSRLSARAAAKLSIGRP